MGASAPHRVLGQTDMGTKTLRHEQAEAVLQVPHRGVRRHLLRDRRSIFSLQRWEEVSGHPEFVILVGAVDIEDLRGNEARSIVCCFLCCLEEDFQPLELAFLLDLVEDDVFMQDAVGEKEV
jgi:hypothetical protein